MRKKLLICSILALILVASLLYIRNKDNNILYEKIAWEALDSKTKSSIMGGFESCQVRKETINGSGKILVSFSSKDDSNLGPITVIINSSTKKAEGVSARK